ncbi:uncharacterized protein LOC122634529 [Vespula pensylvanica]|uniref:Fuseless n=1 Tax=Vespula pensylvanica TaxID=30213 RepID=A0A834KHL4_VESPE|nr:uncharacterized protein LOC122634529 [Vespula pensylvanica]XP_043679487.1 uncharacterized protein LOC122634529 [Vespula pensylvanica]KAF7406911.1 hypothetical protein H0235_014567 [Vespula pensylvanica]
MTNSATRLDQDWIRMVELRAGVGMTGGLDSQSSNRLHYMILTILDTIFSAIVAAPAVVGYWRGTWGLSDAYLYRDDPVFSSFVSVAIGFIGLFVFSITQHRLNDLLHPDKHRLSYYAGSRFYTAVFGFCCVNAWRGAWQALDLYTELIPSTVFATTAVSLLALAIMRAIRNVSAPPFSLSLDSCPGYFEVQTMFRVNNTRGWSLYLLDCAFSVGVVGTLVVFVWRGVWILFDLYLLPEDREYSALGSLAIGYVIVVVTFSLQPLMRYVCARLEGLARLIAADAFLLLSFLGTVNVWRGIWNLLDLWLLPNNLVLSCWITSVGCFVFLLLLNCSNSILVRGVYIDAEEEEGKCVIFPCHYLRLFFKIEREKKEARRRNLLSASKDFASCTDGTGKDAENGALLQNSTSTTIIPGNPESLV